MLVELRQTPEYAKYMEALGWVVRKTNLGKVSVYIKRVLSFLSVAKIQRFEGLIELESMNRALKDEKFTILYLEPNITKDYNYYVDKLNFKPTKFPLLPSKTIVINLTKPEEELLKEMHYKTRYNIKKTQNSNVKVQILGNIEKFAEFWQKDARGRGMFLPMKKEIISIYKSFGKEARILVAVKDEQWLGGI